MIKTILKILIVYTISLATMSWENVNAYTWSNASVPNCYNENNQLVLENSIFSVNDWINILSTYYVREEWTSIWLLNPWACTRVNLKNLWYYNKQLINTKNGMFGIYVSSSDSRFLFFDKNQNNFIYNYFGYSSTSDWYYNSNWVLYSNIWNNFDNNNKYINNIYNNSLTYSTTSTYSLPFENPNFSVNSYIASDGSVYYFDNNYIYKRNKTSLNTSNILINLSLYTSFNNYKTKILVNNNYIVLSGYNITTPTQTQMLVCKISDNSCIFYSWVYVYDLIWDNFFTIKQTDWIDNPLRTFIRTENNIKSLYAVRNWVWQVTTLATTDLISDNSIFTSSSSSSSSGGSSSGSLFDLTVFSDFFGGFTSWLDDFFWFFTDFSEHFYDNDFYGTWITNFSYTWLVNFSSLEEWRSLTAPIYTANSPIFSIIQSNNKYYHNDNIFNYYFLNSRVNDKSEFSMYNESVNHTYFFYKKFNYLNNSWFYNWKILTFNKDFFENFNFIPFYLKIFSIEISNWINKAIYYLLYVLVWFLYFVFEFINFFWQFIYVIHLEIGQCYNYLGQSLCFNNFSWWNRINTVNYYTWWDLLFFVIIILFLTKIIKKYFKY